MLNVRKMTVADIAAGMRLKALAGWNQTEADWRRFLGLSGDGGFAAEWEGQVVGTAVAFVFGRVGSVAMVLVDPAWRRRGIGRTLMENALAYLEDRQVETIRLDATPLGRPVYEKLGFVPDYDLRRMEGLGMPGQPAVRLRPMTDADLEWVADLDHRASGINRPEMIRRLFVDSPEGGRIVASGSGVGGYLMIRQGSRATQLGPAAAIDESAGLALLVDASARLQGEPFFVDIPVDNGAAMAWANDAGLVEQRILTRMHRGLAVADNPLLMWASSGPEKG